MCYWPLSVLKWSQKKHPNMSQGLYWDSGWQNCIKNWGSCRTGRSRDTIRGVLRVNWGVLGVNPKLGVIFRGDDGLLGDLPPKYPRNIRVPLGSPHILVPLEAKSCAQRTHFCIHPSFLIFFHLLGLLPVGGVLEAVMHFFRAHKLLVAPRTQY